MKLMDADICDDLREYSERATDGSLTKWYECRHGNYSSFALVALSHRNEPTVRCDNHVVTAYRDGREAHCNRCGLTADWREPESIFSQKELA